MKLYSTSSHRAATADGRGPGLYNVDPNSTSSHRAATADGRGPGLYSIDPNASGQSQLLAATLVFVEV